MVNSAAKLPEFNQLQQEFNTELTSVKDILRWMVTQFENYGLYYGHGTDNAWDEALHLLYHCLKIPPQFFGNILDAKLCSSEKNKIWACLIARIEERKPLPYITNTAWFFDTDFYVDERVLIPRSPIAELIRNNFAPHLKQEPFRILELCTGSACIAIALAMQFEEAVVDAVDICEAALAVAAINVANYNLENRINLIKSDLFANVGAKKYDLIVVNPPYISEEELEAMPHEYNHEPKKALFANDTGLEFVNRILKEASSYLNDEGILVVELGSHDLDLEAKYPNKNFIWMEFENGGHGVFVITKEDLKNV